MNGNREIVIATSNPNKLKEFRRMLEPLGFKVTSLKEEGVDIDVEETGKTFKDNSLIKADCIAKKLPGKIIIADDSGLEIHALGNFPGIYSARWMEGHTYIEKNTELIRRLEGQKDRSADFVCAITLINFETEPLSFVGQTQGQIAEQILGNDGFGYDPIFIPEGKDRSYAQMSGEEKDQVSHRGKAFRLLLDYLKKHLN
jgi:XTP/dITP diphosphohydrolase